LTFPTSSNSQPGAVASVAHCAELVPGVRTAITSRWGGVSQPPHDPLNLGLSIGDDPAAVLRNREIVARACGIGAGQMAWMRQVHGTRASYVRATAPEPEADAIFTDAAGMALCVLAADCAPVLLADPGTGMIGAAHSGRLGTAAGVVPALVRAMTAAGASPSRMHGLVGPAVCGGCYCVPAGLQARVAEAVPQTRCVTRTGAPGIDIRAGIAAQLAELGVRQVRHDGRCTAETPDLCSHRRDGAAGRFAAMIWRAP
jgi:purine-nucleoside/S-methyl-5'-thioadenosine phosphorylase / adenosine deaminase